MGREEIWAAGRSWAGGLGWAVHVYGKRAGRIRPGREDEPEWRLSTRIHLRGFSFV